jgi:RNA polymerase sigma-70 factor (ECF subfamily)
MAEDLLQETFLRVWKKRGEFRNIASFSTWIYTIAGNLARSEWRRRKRWRMLRLGPSEHEDEPDFELADDGAVPDRVVENRLAASELLEEVAQLPDRYRQVVILRDIQEMSYEEIAGIVQVPVGTVKSRLNRGRLILQEKLGKWYENA